MDCVIQIIVTYMKDPNSIVDKIAKVRNWTFGGLNVKRMFKFIQLHYGSQCVQMTHTLISLIFNLGII